MTQDAVGMTLICSHPCYLMSHQLRGQTEGRAMRSVVWVREGRGRQAKAGLYLIKQVCGTVGDPAL